MAIDVRNWVRAARLRTLPLAFSTILMGAFLAWEKDMFDGLILFLSLLTTLFLQILSNFANDYGDADSGVDSEHRIGPARTVQLGLITRSQMKKGLIVFSILSFVSGLLLIYLAFPENWKLLLLFLALGLAAIAAAIKYTVGNNPYGYAGLGDLFVFIFFGLVGTGGTYFLFTHSIDTRSLLPAVACGFLSVGVLNVNNVRDIESDKTSGKQSIPVRIGKKNAAIYHWVLLLGSMFSMIFYAAGQDYSWQGYLFVLVFPLFFKNGIAVSRKSGRDLDPYLKQLAISTLLMVLLFGMGIFLMKL